MYKKVCNGKSEFVTLDDVLEAFQKYYSNFRNKELRGKFVNRAISDINKGKPRVANGSFYMKVKQ